MLKCQGCKKFVKRKVVSVGLRESDPEKPADRSYDRKKIETECPKCGHKEVSYRYDWLLAGIFSI